MLLNVFEKAKLDCQMIFQGACTNLSPVINHGLEGESFLLSEEYRAYQYKLLLIHLVELMRKQVENTSKQDYKEFLQLSGTSQKEELVLW